MKRFIIVGCVVSALLSTFLTSSAPAASSIGAGVHYLRQISDFDDDEIDKDNFGLIGSLQFGLAMLTLEGNAEYVFDYLGTDEGLFEPSAYALIGGFIYGGAGIGVGRFNGEWQDDPFYALRAGVDVPFGPVSFDIYGTYRFQKDEELEDLTGDDLDAITLAAVLRKSFGSDGY
jgi:hypothetical protein